MYQEEIKELTEKIPADLRCKIKSIVIRYESIHVGNVGFGKYESQPKIEINFYETSKECV